MPRRCLTQRCHTGACHRYPSCHRRKHSEDGWQPVLHEPLPSWASLPADKWIPVTSPLLSGLDVEQMRQALTTLSLPPIWQRTETRLLLRCVASPESHSSCDVRGLSPLWFARPCSIANVKDPGSRGGSIPVPYCYSLAAAWPGTRDDGWYNYSKIGACRFEPDSSATSGGMTPPGDASQHEQS